MNTHLTPQITFDLHPSEQRVPDAVRAGML